MTDHVREAYDANAELYASLFADELDRDRQSLRWLTRFAEIALARSGPVADFGCGPGSATAFLCGLGLDTIGYDISPGQIAQARLAHPDLRFELGDLSSPDIEAGALGGIVSRHSIIHLDPVVVGPVFDRWIALLEPGGAMFLSFFGAREESAHGTPFDHKVITAFALWPETIGRLARASGFCDVEIESVPIPEGGRPFDHVTVLARRPSRQHVPDVRAEAPPTGEN